MVTLDNRLSIIGCAIKGLGYSGETWWRESNAIYFLDIYNISWEIHRMARVLS